MKLSDKSLTKKQIRKTGLPPGSLVFTGEQKLPQSDLSLIKYSENSCEVIESLRVEDIPSLIEKNGIVWINIEGIHDTKLVEKIGEIYCLKIFSIRSSAQNLMNMMMMFSSLQKCFLRINCTTKLLMNK